MCLHKMRPSMPRRKVPARAEPEGGSAAAGPGPWAPPPPPPKALPRPPPRLAALLVRAHRPLPGRSGARAPSAALWAPLGPPFGPSVRSRAFLLGPQPFPGGGEVTTQTLKS